MNIVKPHLKRLVIFTILLAVSVRNVKSGTPKLCPNFCKCDLYDERNYANCSAKRLISPNLEISSVVEILDISHNDITTLDNNCFKSYHFLINLTISNNAIHTIELDVFRRLRRLDTIDLSYNRLEYLDDRLFEVNRHLRTLNLEGNKFTSLLNKPLLRSLSLQTLNLRNSQINFMFPKLFGALPQLLELDLSKNLMITIDADAFDSLEKLRRLNLEGNRWACDQTLMTTVEVLRLRGAEVTLQECDIDEKFVTEIEIPKFERMEMLPSKEIFSTDLSGELLVTNDSLEESVEKSNQTESTLLWNKWRVPSYRNEYDDVGDESADEDADYDHDYAMSPIRITPDGYVCEGSRKLLCLLYGKCVKKVMENIDRHDRNNSGVYTKSDLNLAFLLGCAAGITTVVFIVSCAMCFKSCYEERRRVRVNLEDTYSPAISIAQRHQQSHRRTAPPPPLPPPVPTRSRRSRHSRHSTQISPEYSSRAIVQHDPTNDNFFSRLFGRPTRHQYYRTLNQNTATLIRRLSRSNLFNNRLSQHFAERQRSNGGNANSPSESPIDQDQNHFDYDIASERTNMAPRPETPPPNYGDVVANHKF